MPERMAISRRECLAIASAAVAASLFAGTASAVTRGGPPLSVVERGDRRVYIFGGGIPRDRSWLTPAVASALNEAQELWQEDPPTPSVFNRELNIELGARKNGELFDDLDGSQKARVTEIAKRLNIDLGLLQQMLPWAAGSVIAASDYGNHMEAYKPDDAKGFIQKMFEDRKLPIRSEVDQWDDWVRFYAGFPQAAAVQYMLYQIDLAELPHDRFPRWSDEWLRGDVSGWEGFNRRLARLYPDLYLELEVKRNSVWARRVSAMLNADGAHFINVGIQHTVGPDSIQAKCLDLGLAVRRV